LADFWYRTLKVSNAPKTDFQDGVCEVSPKVLLVSPYASVFDLLQRNDCANIFGKEIVFRIGILQNGTSVLAKLASGEVKVARLF